MRLVGWDEGPAADPQCVAEGLIDLLAVVAGFVVEQQRDGRGSGGPDAIGEGLGDGGGVLGGADRGARERAGVGIDEQLQVDGEALPVEHDDQLGAIADPLGAWVEGLEASSIGRGVGRAASLRGDADAVGLEDVLDVLAAEGDAEVEPDVLAEGAESPLLVGPAIPAVEHGLDASGGGPGNGGEVDGRLDLGPLAAQPVLERRQRDADSLGEGLGADVAMGIPLVEDEEPEAVAVAAALGGPPDGAGVVEDEVPNRVQQGTEVRRRLGRWRGGTPRWPQQAGQGGLHLGLDLVGGGAGCPRRLQDGGGGGGGQVEGTEERNRGEQEAGDERGR